MGATFSWPAESRAWGSWAEPITDANPEVASSIEVVQIDVTTMPVSAAFEAVKSKGTACTHSLITQVLIKCWWHVLPTNFYGPKRVSEAYSLVTTAS